MLAQGCKRKLQAQRRCGVELLIGVAWWAVCEFAGANNGMPSEFVLQKLRATVSASNQQHQPQPMQSGAMGSSPRLQQPQQQQQMVQLGASNNLISNEDLQALGIIEIGTPAAILKRFRF
jgi:hypothetical protein